MTIAQLLEKKTVQKIGKTPMVVVPLHVWHELEDLVEDWEMLHSVAFQKKIARSRKSKKLYSTMEAKKLLGL